jgi:hypothetical protein
MRVAVFWGIRAWETREIVAFQCRSAVRKSFRIVVGVLEYRNEHTEFLSAWWKVVPRSDRRSGMAE